ncbi:hypothetical protein ABPG75_000321 [Micractinium tetrahymenae]
MHLARTAVVALLRVVMHLALIPLRIASWLAADALGLASLGAAGYAICIFLFNATCSEATRSALHSVMRQLAAKAREPLLFQASSWLWVPIFPNAAPTLSTWAATLGIFYAVLGLLAGMLGCAAGKPAPGDPARALGHTFVGELLTLAGKAVLATIFLL